MLKLTIFQICYDFEFSFCLKFSSSSLESLINEKIYLISASFLKLNCLTNIFYFSYDMKPIWFYYNSCD